MWLVQVSRARSVLTLRPAELEFYTVPVFTLSYGATSAVYGSPSIRVIVWLRVGAYFSSERRLAHVRRGRHWCATTNSTVDPRSVGVTNSRDVNSRLMGPTLASI